MLSPKSFLKSVEKIDEKFAAFNASIESPDYIAISKKFWISDLESFIEENKDEIAENIEQLEEAAQKKYAKYISPLFKSLLINLTFDDFSAHFELSKTKFKSLISSLESARTPARAQKIVDELKVIGDRYFINTRLRPWHPVLYLLQDLKKTIKSPEELEINAPKLIASIYPYIIFPQNKYTPEILCALSLVLGLPIKSILQISSAKKLDDFSLKITIKRSTFSRPVICKAEHVCRTIEFVAAQKYSKSRASNTSLETSKKVLGFAFSALSMPALYQALCIYFFARTEQQASLFLEKYDLEVNSKFQFKIQGEANLPRIIETILDERQKQISAILSQADDNIRDRLASALQHYEQNYTEKLGVTNTRLALACAPSLASGINKQLDVL
ncbi:MAG TPA: hypothetical protein VFO10_18485 [Oligoflexus sp.]|uniref:hypothetical protein n=1 Tax=Oligoflexus sp. TaxID=1971216 RepID=UPI002D7E583B|nr:hypothetical protein [Oligoflexus sp.]HET9239254.1 hypothetical protein [Oligoflexus sp.]